MTLSDTLLPDENGVCQRVIVWGSDDGDTIITWNKSSTFQQFSFYKRFSTQVYAWGEDDCGIWTMPNEVRSFDEACELPRPKGRGILAREW